MKVVLQNKTTGSFFAEGNRWVEDIAEAIPFEHSIAAMEHSKREGLSDTNVFIKAPNGEGIVIRCTR